MLTRRDFLASVGATSFTAAWCRNAQPAEPKKKLAVVTTLWNYRSHAWHMAERFLHGYPREGLWHRPPFDVVAAYVDQVRDDDLSRKRADEFGFKIYPTIAQAVRNGGDNLAVDAVLVIGEHGDYPLNEFGQKQYPRYEFFKQITDVYRQDGRSVPIFNDKHLSWSFARAKEMVDISKELKFPFLAGSSLPVTWRMPSVEMPLGAEIEEAMVIAMGAIDIYDFHALETLQCMTERRRGGETGVVAVQGLRGESVWKAMQAGSWAKGGWSPELFTSCLSRSHTLKQGPTLSHRYPTEAQIREWVKEPIAYRIEYADGLKATMLLLNGLVGDFTFAAKLKGQDAPLSTLFHLPPEPNVTYSASLMANAEKMFVTGKAPYPVERTLLTSGLVEACMQSLVQEQKRQETPHLAVKYAPPTESSFARS